MARLDSEVWSQSPLGLVGLPGAVTAVSLGMGATSYYTPLYDWMRSPAAIPASLRNRCELLVGRRPIERTVVGRIDARSAGVLNVALSAPVSLRSCVLLSPDLRDLQAAGVVADPRDGSRVVIALCYWVSAEVSRSVEPDDVFGRLAMLGVFAEDLVEAGYVGVVGAVPDARVRRTLAPILSGISTLKDVVEGLGVQP